MSLETPPPPVRRWFGGFAVRHLALALPVVLVIGYYAADAYDPDSVDSLVENLPLRELMPGYVAPLSADALRLRFGADSTATVQGATLELQPEVYGFYAARAFAPVWSDEGARDTLIAELRAAEDEGFRAGEVGADRLAARLEAGVAAESTRVDLELLLTDGYFRLADALLGRRVTPDSLYGGLWKPARRTADPARLLADAVASETPAAAVATALERLRPSAPEYAALRAELARIRRDDGTPTLPEGAALAPGETSALTPLLRQRLSRTGDYTGPTVADSVANYFDTALSAALGRFQARHGLSSTEALDETTRTALNRPGNRAVPLLAANLERWRWLPDSLGDRHVWVNLPSFTLQLRDRDGAGWRTERDMRVVIGSDGRWRTPVFSDTISQVVFNPTWTIPASIQMQSYGRVNPRGIVRGPGPGNPLGRVKFVFPNPDGIYLHDTTAKWAFQRDTRALSHGCIRLGDPQALADAVMAGEGWDTTRVASQFTGAWRTNPVDLTRPIPVHLVYFTAAPDADGRMVYFDDVYRYDERLARALGYTDEEIAAAQEAE